MVYWMQRAQRATDNPALDVAIRVGNELKKPVVVFLAPVPFYPRANLRHYHFLAEGVPDIAEGLSARGVGFVLRPYPDHSLLKFCEEVRPAMVIGDENPMREPERWRVKVASRIRVPLWTVDADTVVPTKLLLKEQFAARTIRPRIHALLPRFLARPKNLKAQVRWAPPARLHSLLPHDDLMAGWKLDRSVQPVPGMAWWEQARAAHTAGIREPAPGGLSRVAQLPRATRHEPAVSVSALRARGSAHGCARGAAQRRARPGEGRVSRTGDREARAGDQFRALQPGL